MFVICNFVKYNYVAYLYRTTTCFFYMINNLGNYIQGAWQNGEDDGALLIDAVTAEPIATASTKGIDMEAALHFARVKGNAALRKLTFHERGRMLKALANYLLERKEKYYALSLKTGATRADSWIDIEGGFGNLFSNASLRRKFPDLPYCTDGDAVPLSKEGNFTAHHILVPRTGVAIHINAFNFPVWGMLEKCAVNWLAGMPAIVKPATITSYLTQAVVQDIIASKILPEGALQLLCGSAGNLLNFVQPQDVVTFTGSATTGLMLKSHEAILKNNVPFNCEADSLNAIMLGEDVAVGSKEWDIFIKEVRKEITVKAGQKCTAVRRILIPENKVEDAYIAIGKALQQTVIGNPLNDKVRMGALAGYSQRNEVEEQLQKLLKTSEIIYKNNDLKPLDADVKIGAFTSPILLLNKDANNEENAVHNIECFGPVASILPYKNTDDAIAMVKMSKGSLCCSIVTNDANIATQFVVEAATHHGRILVLNADCAKESTGHGSPLPMLVHGGPGRAGGGEEMGGLRGVKHYMQRAAIQGSPCMITAITQQYQPNAKGNITEMHPFKKHYEELHIGDQLLSEKRLITTEDIDAFANLSGDHFYAHKLASNFDGTMFEKQVAHGYLIMSLTAGLFVDSYEINPVLLNYGIDELRFTKPIYAGTNIQVRFTCKEKLPNDNRVLNDPSEFKRGDDIEKGIVKWLVEILDETDEPLVGIGTILTMVKRKG
jgi:oxepin-CoA hydrolase / 3-oxo-5,6-dehydrosuberyl-CoA semialdehyde dehydrogenase